MTKKHAGLPLKERIDHALELVEELAELLPDLIELDILTRKHSIGKLRDGETDAMRAVLDAADAEPDYFRALAGKDRGDDAKRFETKPSREALDQRDELARLHKVLRLFSLRLSDTILHLGAEARAVTNAAYHIARVNSDADPKLKTLLEPAFKFYARGGRPKSAAKKKT
ncbi:MAG TPA: hypothetical protein VF407_23220 [Polyangiaceae bacterium]